MIRKYDVVDLGPEAGRSIQALITDMQQTRAAHALALEYGYRDDAEIERNKLRVLEAELTARRDLTRRDAPRLEAFDRIVEQPDMSDDQVEAILDEADAAEFGDLPLREVEGVAGVPLMRLEGQAGALLSIGECLILSGEGGSGKSSFFLQLALEASRPRATKWVDGLGLSLRRGPVFYASYEDSPQRARDRALELLGTKRLRSIPEPLYIGNMSGKPLFGPTMAVPFYDAVPGRLSAWAPFWKRVAARIIEGRKLCPGPGLVVVDPAAEAFVGDELRTTAVRQFLDSCCVVCRTLGIGLVVIAHPSKLGLTRVGARGSESIAGTAAWHDAARGVLSFRREGDIWTLKAEKANYGPADVSIYLTREGGGPFRVRPVPEARAVPATPAKERSEPQGVADPPKPKLVEAAPPRPRRRCSPHRWRTPKVGDTDIVCVECAHSLSIARLQARMILSMSKVRREAGDPEFEKALVAAHRFAKESKR